METVINLPKRHGQICRILSPLDERQAADVFIVTEDPVPFDEEDNIYVTSLKDLQRNIKHPQNVSPLAVRKNELTVVAETLEEYIKTWNDHKLS